jgi:hypothetical protein
MKCGLMRISLSSPGLCTTMQRAAAFSDSGTPTLLRQAASGEVPGWRRCVQLRGRKHLSRPAEAGHTTQDPGSPDDEVQSEFGRYPLRAVPGQRLLNSRALGVS